MPKKIIKAEAVTKNEIIVIDDQIAPLQDSIIMLQQLPALSTPAHMELASDTLSKVNTIADALEADKKKITAPLNEAIAEVRSRYKPAEGILKPIIERLRSMTSDYQTKAIMAARAEEARIAARVGEGKGKLTVTTAARKLGEIEKPAEKVVSAAGSVAFREDKVLKIVSESLVWNHAVENPKLGYLTINEDAVLEALKAGAIVPGAEISIKMSPINRRA